MGRKTPVRIGSPCRHCGTPLVRRDTKKHRRGSGIRYRWYYWCNRCHALYLTQEAMFIQKDPQSHFQDLVPDSGQDEIGRYAERKGMNHG